MPQVTADECSPERGGFDLNHCIAIFQQLYELCCLVSFVAASSLMNCFYVELLSCYSLSLSGI